MENNVKYTKLIDDWILYWLKMDWNDPDNREIFNTELMKVLDVVKYPDLATNMLVFGKEISEEEYNNMKKTGKDTKSKENISGVIGSLWVWEATTKKELMNIADELEK